MNCVSRLEIGFLSVLRAFVIAVAVTVIAIAGSHLEGVLPCR